MNQLLQLRKIRRVTALGASILICSSAPAQNLFLSFDAILEYSPNGDRTTFASGLNNPRAIAFDSSGNLFVANAGALGESSTVYKFTPDGVRTTFTSGLVYPGGLAFDRAGNLFVADTPDTRPGAVYKVTPDGVRTTFASGLVAPVGLAFDSAGNLFVADGGAIYKFTPAGMRTTFALVPDANRGLAFDQAGNLFVAGGVDDINAGLVRKFTPTGVQTTFASGLNYPFALAFDNQGNLFVSDLGYERSDMVLGMAVYKFTPSGARTTFTSGSALSLAFQPPHPATPMLANISARGSVETGEGAIISGFIVTGSDSEQVIIRALGPTLTSFGISDALQDPVLGLHNNTSMVTSNDDWQNAANAGQIPMNYRPPDMRESVIMTTLPPSSYTTVLSGKNAGPGTGLLQVYSTSSGLSNASVRGFVGTGDHVLIGGFSSNGGNGSIQLIIRALGPTLTQFGVNGAVADPTLILVNSNGNLIATNDNWKNAQQNVIQVTGFAPPNDLESAIFATLPNGNYTAIVTGKNGTTGVGLLEVYKVALATDK